MDHLSAEMRACIEECLRCHKTCLSIAMNHCLTVGGKHVEPQHFKLMMACAESCQASANQMIIGTEHHRQMCGVCAAICTACAESCEAVGDMEECVRQCRACAENCRKMAA